MYLNRLRCSILPSHPVSAVVQWSSFPDPWPVSWRGRWNELRSTRICYGRTFWTVLWTSVKIATPQMSWMSKDNPQALPDESYPKCWKEIWDKNDTLSRLSSFFAAFLLTWPCNLTMPRMTFWYFCLAMKALTAACMTIVFASLWIA